MRGGRVRSARRAWSQAPGRSPWPFLPVGVRDQEELVTRNEEPLTRRPRHEHAFLWKAGRGPALFDSELDMARTVRAVAPRLRGVAREGCRGCGWMHLHCIVSPLPIPSVCI